VFSTPSNHLTAPVYAASLECINLILAKFPSIQPTGNLKNASKNLPNQYKNQLLEFAAYKFQANFGSQEAAILKSSDIFKYWSQGLMASKKNDVSEIISNFVSFFKLYKTTKV